VQETKEIVSRKNLANPDRQLTILVTEGSCHIVEIEEQRRWRAIARQFAGSSFPPRVTPTHHVFERCFNIPEA